MKLTLEGDIEEIKTSVSDYSSVGEEALFSLQLFHRWYIIYMIAVFKLLLIYNYTCKIKKNPEIFHKVNSKLKQNLPWIKLKVEQDFVRS